LEQITEFMTRAVTLSEKYQEAFVVATIECRTIAVRADGERLALDTDLQAPLTFVERGPAEKVAERWNATGDRPTVAALPVIGFHAAVIDETPDDVLLDLQR
jgi:hypothetical protein